MPEHFIGKAYDLGIRYVISTSIPKDCPEDLFVLKVKDTQCALWTLAQKYRQMF